jgi:membrane associated rhomboid family serine protease
MTQVTFLIFSALAIAVALRVTTPAERERARHFVLALGKEVKDAAALNREKCEPFQQTLRARSRWPILTAVLVTINCAVFAGAFLEPGAIGLAKTLTAWGGNLGPLTTNGQWWRIPSSIFLHTSLVHFLVTVAALAQVASILERLIGRTTVGVAYGAAGIFAGLASVWTAPMAVNAGASGSVFSLYGLLLVIPIRNWRDPESERIPRAVWKRLVPVAVMFSAYSFSNDALATSAELLGLVTGFVSGLVLLWEPGESRYRFGGSRSPRARRCSSRRWRPFPSAASLTYARKSNGWLASKPEPPSRIRWQPKSSRSGRSPPKRWPR